MDRFFIIYNDELSPYVLITHQAKHSGWFLMRNKKITADTSIALIKSMIKAIYQTIYLTNHVTE